eukprot:1156560-Pelagomonas_calceolata.AAC.2
MSVSDWERVGGCGDAHPVRMCASSSMQNVLPCGHPECQPGSLLCDLAYVLGNLLGLPTRIMQQST